jgi:hypothetical protein
MMTRQEQEDIRQILYQELARMHYQIAHYSGSYRYLCLVDGSPAFTHSPIGPVISILK